MSDILTVHGLDLSYFTGKLEAYLRVKGIAYRFQEMDTADFAACAKATGFKQMPQVQLPNGDWLTDTTLTIEYYEKLHPEPQLTPADPTLRFLAHLLEDAGDEMLWRPALYYRWAFAEDAQLMSSRIARGMLRDLHLPLTLRRWIALNRQRRIYLRQDGVTANNSTAIEALYSDALQAMEQALEAQPFLLGARPCAADFGFFGSMFRHFFSDPTAAAIMREHAPRTMLWVARLWAARPADLGPAAWKITAHAEGLLKLAAATHLPYCAANAAAFASGQKHVEFTDRGAEFRTLVSPYRVWCLNRLQREFANLNAESRVELGRLLGHAAVQVLEMLPLIDADIGAPVLPIRPAAASHPRNRNWAGAKIRK
jgi:glutathione S-transferase